MLLLFRSIDKAIRHVIIYLTEYNIYHTGGYKALSHKITEISLSAAPSIKEVLRTNKVYLKTLKSRIVRVIEHPFIQDYLPPKSEVCISLINDVDIQSLNREYRGKDKPTDVLSFALLEGDDLCIPSEIATPLGDILISVETAIQQSQSNGLPRLQPYLRHQVWGVAEELAFLSLHGLLHLLGFDHEEDIEAEEMEGVEAYLLKTLFPLLALSAPKPIIPVQTGKD